MTYSRGDALQRMSKECIQEKSYSKVHPVDKAREGEGNPSTPTAGFRQGRGPKAELKWGSW